MSPYVTSWVEAIDIHGKAYNLGHHKSHILIFHLWQQFWGGLLFLTIPMKKQNKAKQNNNNNKKKTSKAPFNNMV